MAQIGLGSAQFGMDYGIANTAGQCPKDDIARILARATDAGVELLDTAAEYGDAEARLGACLPKDHTFRIVTKTLDLATVIDADAIVEGLTDGFERSLQRLRQTAVYGLLVHNANNLLGPLGSVIWRTLEDFRTRKLVEKIGVSVYTGAQIDPLLDRYPLDIVQLPVNVFDQRLIAGGQLAKLHRRGIEVHARSVFLQGVLLVPPKKLPRHLRHVARPLQRWQGFVRRQGVDLVAGAIDFVRAQGEIDALIIGVTGVPEFDEILAAAENAPLPSPFWPRFAVDDETVIDPRLWPPRRTTNSESSTVSDASRGRRR